MSVLRRVNGVMALAVGAALCAPASVAAQSLRVASGVEYTRGLYGAYLPTESLIATVSARYSGDGWALGVVIPYVRVTGPGAPFDPFAVSYLAVVRPAGEEDSIVPVLSLPDDRAFSFQLTSPTSEGLGDISISLSRSFELTRNRLYLDASAIVKLPTGDVDKLIGTGQTDVSLRSDFVYEGDRIGVFAGAGYVVTGKSPLFELQDRWQLSAGVYAPIGRKLTIGAMYDWRSPLVVDSTAISEVTPYLSMQVSSRFNVLAYAVAGFSEASPGYGAGLRFAVDFDAKRRR